MIILQRGEITRYRAPSCSRLFSALTGSDRIGLSQAHCERRLDGITCGEKEFR
jgi:hypothetical protein